MSPSQALTPAAFSPSVLYVEHGNDFTSDHITTVAAGLHRR